jgi:hypothetical protein
MTTFTVNQLLEKFSWIGRYAGAALNIIAQQHGGDTEIALRDVLDMKQVPASEKIEIANCVLPERLGKKLVAAIIPDVEDMVSKLRAEPIFHYHILYGDYTGLGPHRAGGAIRELESIKREETCFAEACYVFGKISRTLCRLLYGDNYMETAEWNAVDSQILGHVREILNDTEEGETK